MPAVELIRCPSCGVMNQIPQEKLSQGLPPVCGRCKTPLPVPVNDSNFAAQIERSSLPVVLDLWAPWCGPCRMIAPIIDQLAVEMAGRVRFAKLNVDENPASAARFNAGSIPTLLVLKDGRELDRIVGVQPIGAIKSRIERAVAAAGANPVGAR